MTTGDCFLLEGGNERLSLPSSFECFNNMRFKNKAFPQCRTLPYSSTVSTLLVLKDCCLPDVEKFKIEDLIACNAKNDHKIAKMLKYKYKSFTEITSDSTFPLTSTLKPLNISGRLLYYTDDMFNCEMEQYLMKIKLADRPKDRIEYLNHKIPGESMDYVNYFHFSDLCKKCGFQIPSSVFGSKGSSDVVMIDATFFTNKKYNHFQYSIKEYGFTEISTKRLLLSMVIAVSENYGK